MSELTPAQVFRAFHGRLEKLLDKHPDHQSVRMIMACTICSRQLYTQLDRRRVLDAQGEK